MYSVPLFPLRLRARRLFAVLAFAFTLASVAVAAAPATNEELSAAMATRTQRVPEFRFIREEAEKLGVRAWLFGGTAAAFGHYVKWDLEREAGDPKYLPNRFDYDYTNIYRSTQDLDIVIDGTPEEADALQDALRTRYPHLQGNKDLSAWEVRLLRKSMGDKLAILDNPDFVNQHSDSNSTGMVEVTPTPKDEPAVRDVMDWNAKEPNFLKDVHDGKLHYYFNPKHGTTKFAKEGRNPPILSVIRYLTKALQFELELRPEDLARVKKIIQDFDPKRDTKNEYVRRWLLEKDNGRKLVQNAVNMEYARKLLDETGLRKKLLAVPGNHAGDPGSLAWWLNKQPLESRPFGTKGKTARELGLDVVSHETNSFAAWESITKSTRGEPNVFISREDAVGESAVYGDGFYTRTGREGARGTNLTVRFHVDPAAREGADFIRSGDFIIVTNRRALRVIDESFNWNLPDYLRFLLLGDQIEPGNKAQFEKLSRRIKNQTHTEAQVLAELRPLFDEIIDEKQLLHAQGLTRLTEEFPSLSNFVRGKVREAIAAIGSIGPGTSVATVRALAENPAYRDLALPLLEAHVRKEPSQSLILFLEKMNADPAAIREAQSLLVRGRRPGWQGAAAELTRKYWTLAEALAFGNELGHDHHAVEIIDAGAKARPHWLRGQEQVLVDWLQNLQREGRFPSGYYLAALHPRGEKVPEFTGALNRILRQNNRDGRAWDWPALAYVHATEGLDEALVVENLELSRLRHPRDPQLLEELFRHPGQPAKLKPALEAMALDDDDLRSQAFSLLKRTDGDRAAFAERAVRHWLDHGTQVEPELLGWVLAESPAARATYADELGRMAQHRGWTKGDASRFRDYVRANRRHLQKLGDLAGLPARETCALMYAAMTPVQKAVRYSIALGALGGSATYAIQGVRELDQRRRDYQKKLDEFSARLEEAKTPAEVSLALGLTGIDADEMPPNRAARQYRDAIADILARYLPRFVSFGPGATEIARYGRWLRGPAQGRAWAALRDANPTPRDYLNALHATKRRVDRESNEQEALAASWRENYPAFLRARPSADELNELAAELGSWPAISELASAALAATRTPAEVLQVFAGAWGRPDQTLASALGDAFRRDRERLSQLPFTKEEVEELRRTGFFQPDDLLPLTLKTARSRADLFPFVEQTYAREDQVAALARYDELAGTAGPGYKELLVTVNHCGSEPTCRMAVDLAVRAAATTDEFLAVADRHHGYDQSDILRNLDAYFALRPSPEQLRQLRDRFADAPGWSKVSEAGAPRATTKQELELLLTQPPGRSLYPDDSQRLERLRQQFGARYRALGGDPDFLSPLPH